MVTMMRMTMSLACTLQLRRAVSPEFTITVECLMILAIIQIKVGKVRNDDVLMITLTVECMPMFAMIVVKSNK